MVIATCGRIDLSNDIECESPEDISKWISSFVEINNLGILFGREDRGLSNNELLFAHKILNIKTSQNYPSLNLSHAVSIILYELNKSSTNNAEKDLQVFDLASSKQIYETFKGPFGSTNTTFKLSLFFFKFITSYVNTLIN